MRTLRHHILYRLVGKRGSKATTVARVVVKLTHSKGGDEPARFPEPSKRRGGPRRPDAAQQVDARF